MTAVSMHCISTLRETRWGSACWVISWWYGTFFIHSLYSGYLQYTSTGTCLYLQYSTTCLDYLHILCTVCEAISAFRSISFGYKKTFYSKNLKLFTFYPHAINYLPVLLFPYRLHLVLTICAPSFGIGRGRRSFYPSKPATHPTSSRSVPVRQRIP
jgi:hypothetical protein